VIGGLVQQQKVRFFQQQSRQTGAGALAPAELRSGLIPQFAREVQDRILPSTRPFIPNLDYYSDSRRAHSLNGDYLDYFDP